MVVGKKLYELMVVLVLSTLWVVLNVQTARATGAELEIFTSYEVLDKSTVQVRSIINIQNTDGEASIGSLEIPAPGSNVGNVRAFYQDDDIVEASYDREREVITLVTSRDFSGDLRQWSVVVDYETQLGIELGQSFIVQIPASQYQPHAVNKETISLSSSTDLGAISRRGPEPATTQIAAGNQILTWQNDSGTIGEPLGLIMGDSGVAQVSLRTDVVNTSWWWKTVTVTLPSDTNQQRTFLRSITPKPSNLKLDIDGNILAEYRLRPKHSFQVEAIAEVDVNNVLYPFESAGVLSDISSDLVSNYTALNSIWVSSFQAQGDLLQDRIREYYEDATSFEAQGVGEYEKAIAISNRMIGNLRNDGIPARLVLGKVFVDGQSVASSARSHAWAEAYIPGIGWATLDPALDHQAGNYGSSDVRHVGLVLRGISADFPPERLNNISITYTDEEEPRVSTALPMLGAVKYMIIPGISLRSVNVELPDGPIVDFTGITVGGEPARALGSLAPLQTASIRSLDFAGNAFSSAAVEYGVLSEGEMSEVLQISTITVNYVPMAIILILSGAGAATYWLTRRHNNRKLERVERTKDAVVLATEDMGEEIELSNLVDDPVDDTETPEANDDTMLPDEKTTNSTAERAPRRAPGSTAVSARRRPTRRSSRSKLVQ